MQGSLGNPETEGTGELSECLLEREVPLTSKSSQSGGGPSFWAQAALLGVGGLNNRNVFSHNSRGLKYRIKVSLGLVSPEVSLLSLASFHWVPTWPLLHGVLLSPHVSTSSSYKDPGQDTGQFGPGHPRGLMLIQSPL